jgi:hypothetical protein
MAIRIEKFLRTPPRHHQWIAAYRFKSPYRAVNAANHHLLSY